MNLIMSKKKFNQRELLIYEELVKSYLLTSFDTPENEVLIAKIRAYNEKLSCIPFKFLSKSFELARREKELPSSTFVLKAYNEKLSSIARQEKMQYVELAREQKDTIDYLCITLERLTIYKKYNLENVKLLSKEFLKIVKSDEFVRDTNIFNKEFEEVRKYIMTIEDFSKLRSLNLLCRDKNLKGNDLTKHIPKNILSKFSAILR